MSEPRLLATDLDGTFIGDDDAMFALWADLDRADIMVAFSTGRHLPSIEAFYSEHQTTRRAVACVCMVGTEIWHLIDGGYRRDHEWSDVISDSWDKDRVEAIVHETTGAVMQPLEWQSEFKTSYYLEGSAPEGLAHIESRLDEEGLRAKVVYSADRFLDVVPHRSGKGEAVRFLADQLDVPPTSVVTCGDTGNDLDMMRPELGFWSVAVGNAAPELASYQAPRMFHAESSYAAGIREGLLRVGWLS